MQLLNYQNFQSINIRLKELYFILYTCIHVCQKTLTILHIFKEIAKDGKVDGMSKLW